MIIDGAHNPEGIDAAVESIKYYFRDERVCVLTGVMRDKDYEYVAKRLAEIAKSAFCIKPDNPRALDAEEYAKVLAKNGVDATHRPSVAEAFRDAREYAAQNNCALVCLGSLYMYEEIFGLLY